MAKDLVTQSSNCRALSRRHTITVCDMESGGRKVQQKPSVEPVINENDEIPRENFVRGHAARRPTRLVGYRQHGSKMHDSCVQVDKHRVHGTDVSRSDSPKMHANVPSRRHSDIFVSNQNRVHDSRNSVCTSVSNSVVNPTRSVSPGRHAPRSVSPCKHAGRAESPVRFLSRSETFTTSIPHNAKNCVRNEPYVTARCDSPQLRQMARSESFSESSRPVRCESPQRHSVSSVRSHRSVACEGQNVHDRCSSPCRKVALSERSASPCGKVSGNRSRSQSPCRRLSQTDNTHVSSRSHASNKAVPVLRHSRSVQRMQSASASDYNNIDNHDTHIENSNNAVPSQRRTRYVSVKEYHSRRQLRESNSSHENQNNLNQAVPLSRESDQFSLQESRSEHVQREQEATSASDKTRKQRPAIIRARSKPEIRTAGLVVKSDNFETEVKHSARERPVSELDFRRPFSSRIPRALSTRSKSEKQLFSTSLDESNDLNKERQISGGRTVTTENKEQHIPDTTSNSEKQNESKSRRNVKVDPKEAQHWGLIESKPKREVKLSRQSAIRSERKDVRLTQKEHGENSMMGDIDTQTDQKSRKSGVSTSHIKDQSVEMRLNDHSEVGTKSDISESLVKEKEIGKSAHDKPQVKIRTRQRVAFNDSESKQSVNEHESQSASNKPIRSITRSKSEVRPRPEVKDISGPAAVQHRPEIRLRSEKPEMRSRSPVRGLHFLDKVDSVEKTNDSAVSIRERLNVSPVPSPNKDKDISEADCAIEGSSSTFGGLSSAIKGLSQLNVTDLLHVSWKSDCPRKDTNNSSPCSDCRPIPVSITNPLASSFSLSLSRTKLLSHVISRIFFQF